MSTGVLEADVATRPPTLNDIQESARWHVHQVQIDGQAEIVPMTLESYRESSFLDHRIKRPEPLQAYTADFVELGKRLGDVAGYDTRYIFHISHVGSTLLSRVAGTLPGVLALREPLLLRWLADIRRDLRQPESRFTQAGYEVRLRTALGLLARPIEGADKVVVKATSYASSLATDIMTLQPKARATAIYCRFESFAATVLRGKGGWIDMLSQAPSRMHRLHERLGRQPWQLAYMSPGEIVALNWLTEMLALTDAAARFPDRFVWGDFDTFIADPLAEAGGFVRGLGLDWSEHDVAALRESGVLSRYSKHPDRAYDAREREKEKAEALARQAGEIRKGRAWLDRALSDNPQFARTAPFAASQDPVSA